MFIYKKWDQGDQDVELQQEHQRFIRQSRQENQQSAEMTNSNLNQPRLFDDFYEPHFENSHPGMNFNMPTFGQGWNQQSWQQEWDQQETFSWNNQENWQGLNK